MIAEITHAAATCAVAACATEDKEWSAAATTIGVATAFPAVDPVPKPGIGFSLNSFKST